MGEYVALAIAVAAAISAAWLVRWWFVSRRTSLGSPEDRATYETLHTASLAAPALRTGLAPGTVGAALPHLRRLLGAEIVGITDTSGPLGWSGGDESERTADLVGAVLQSGRTMAAGPVIVAPLSVENRVVGTFVVIGAEASGGLARTTTEVAGWMSSQLELAELASSRTALMEAELRALRAQISPHFIYNSLGAIASFVRTDPERARDLLLEFADFTRYSFRQHGEFTTLAEELRSIERYLVLEKARFGDRLRVVMRIAPEVLGVTIPFLSIQPLVENAVRHGLEKKDGVGTITVAADDAGSACLISVEDDGVGSDPDTMRDALAGRTTSASVGLANVDERLRTVYGNDHGVVIETGPGLGTKVIVEVPKFVEPRDP